MGSQVAFRTVHAPPVCCKRGRCGELSGADFSSFGAAVAVRLNGFLAACRDVTGDQTSTGYREVLYLHAQLALNDRGRQYVGLQF
jgi:hypothetical protein